MTKKLHLRILPFVLGAAFTANAQNLVLERYIMVTDTVTEDEVTFNASSDDAEQENDAIDALFDDDLDAGWEGAPEDQNTLTTGLRFRFIEIPRGAVIDSAFLNIVSHEAKSADDVAELTIWGNKVGDAATFNETDLITNRAQTTAKIDWTVDEAWGLWTSHRTPDLKAVVQEVINQEDWKAGNALALIIQGENQGPSDFENAREFESFENIADPEDGGDGQNHPDRVPQLVVYYHIPEAVFEQRIQFTNVITEDEVTFNASSDDAEQENDAIDALFDDDLDAGWEGAPEDQNTLSTGMIFRDVFIPKGVSIDSAFVEVTSHEAKGADDVAQLTIVGEASDNAATYNEQNLITARAQTTAKIDWTVDEAWGLWTTHRTPNIAAVVQEVINRNGWQPGNAVALMFLGENQGPSDFENAREWESFENIADPEDGGDGQNHPERVPKLIVHYSSNGVNGIIEFTSHIKALNVFPNPSNTGVVNVDLSGSTPANIQLYNLTGSVVKTVNNAIGLTAINISGLPAGIYFVNAQQGNETLVSKLIVK